MVALLGANGAGKTSTLRAVSGMHPLKSGTITFEGKNLAQVPGHLIIDLGIAHCPEGRQVFGRLSEMEHARGVVPNLPDGIEIKWNFAELTDCGATGDPTKATVQKGRLMEEALLNALVKFFEKMDACDWRYNSSQSAL